MNDRTRDAWSHLLIAALMLQCLGCGTILHPERKGQRDGRIDAGIAVLDGLGLLFFIIPGVISFAVDFSNGTIYLPGGKSARHRIETLRFDPNGDEKADIERLVRAKTGYPVKFGQEGLEVVALRSKNELPARLLAVHGSNEPSPRPSK